MKFLFLFPLVLSACSITPQQKPIKSAPFIANLHSIELVFGEPYRSVYEITEKTENGEDEDFMIVSNACGIAFARLDNSLTDRVEKLEVTKNIGEWCENPFQSLYADNFLYIPDTVETDQKWREGKVSLQSGRFFELHKTDLGTYASPLEMTRHKSRYVDLKKTNDFLKKNNLPSVETFSKPQLIYWYDEAEVLEYPDDFTYNKTLFNLVKEDSRFNLYLLKGIPLDKPFPDLAKDIEWDIDWLKD